MNLTSTEPMCSAGTLLPSPPRQHHPLSFITKAPLALTLLFITLLTSLTVQATAPNTNQTLDQLKVTIDLTDSNLPTLFHQIQSQTGLTFAYTPADVSAYTITLPKATRSVKATLDLALIGTGLLYEQVAHNVIVSKELTPAIPERVALIQGTVKDASGQSMPGVNVLVKGTTTGTTTDGEGRFVIDAKESDVLVFSFIGFKPQEQVVGTRSVIEVVLEDDVEALKEVVVNAGYYQTTDRMKTGSISRVAAKEIETQPVTSPLMALQGRMPGVDITPVNGVPGSAVKVQIRGLNSLRMGGDNGNGNLPLYVIDGVPVDSSPLLPASTSLVGQGFDPISTINPANIESIEVLKDADATAIYGSRGANGVILITTKRGTRAERTEVDVNAYHGVGKVGYMMPLLNTQQYLQMRKEALKNDGVALTSTTLRAIDLTRWDTTRFTDWQKVLIGGNARVTDVQGNISGSAGNTSFRLGGAFHKETLVFPGDFGYQRASGNFNLNHVSSNQKIRLALSLNYGAERNRLFDDSRVLTAALTLAPNAPDLYDEQGNLNWENSTFDNPLAGQQKTDDVNVRSLVTNCNLSYELVKGLAIKVNIGYTDLNGSEFAKYPISSYNPAYAAYYVGGVYSGINKRQSWIIEPQLLYTKIRGDHTFNFVIGTTWQESSQLSQLISGQGYTSDALLGNMRAADVTFFERDDDVLYRYTALFARAGYDFRGKYLLNFTGRRDGSSRFGPDKRYANFGAIGAAWVFSEENIVKNYLPFLSFGKIRASYGITGNDQIGDYRYFDTYSLATRRYQDNISLNPTSLFNPDFAWEVTRKTEAALELGAFENRVSAEIAWYNNESSNQLVDIALPYTTGFSSIFSNLNARIRNTGLEIVIKTENIRNNKFHWSTSVNFSKPQNRLVDFPNIKSSPYYSSVYEVGKPVSIVKLYNYQGVNSENGIYEIEDVDGDGAITPEKDAKIISTLTRKYYGGITNILVYRSFELSVLFQFSDRYAQGYSFLMPGLQGNQPADVLERWKKEGDNTSVQKFSQLRTGDTPTQYSLHRNSNGAIDRASFLRLKTLSLSYSLPSPFLDRLGVQTAKLYLQGQNLFTMTSYLGWDPETGTSLPPLKMLTIGIQAKI